MRLLESTIAQKQLLFASFLFLCFSGIAQVDSGTVSKIPAKDTIDIVVTNGVQIEKPKNNLFELSQVSIRPISLSPYISVQQYLKGNAAGVYIQEPSGEPGTEQNIFIRGISFPLLSKRELYDQQAAVFVNGIPLVQDNPFAYEIQKYDFNRIGPANNLLTSISQDNIESIEIIKDPLTLASLGPVASNGVIWITTKNARSGFSDITVNSYFGYSQKPNITPVNAAYENNFRKPFYDKYATNSNRLSYPAFLKDSTNADYYGPANWSDLYYHNSPLYNLDLSLTGGSERANFRFFGSVTKNASSADKTAINRYTGSFYINVAPIKWLVVSSMISYNRLDRKRNKNIRDRLAEQRYLPDLTNPLTPNKMLYSSYLSEFDKVIDNNISNVLQGYIAVSADLKKLTYKGRVAFDYNEGIRDAFWPTTLLEGNNFVSNYFGYNQRILASNQLTYEFKFNDKQKLQLEAGQNFMMDVYKYDYAYAYNGPNDFVKINVVNPADLTPTAFRVYYYPSKMQSVLASFSGKAAYSLNEILNVSAIVRRDGSSNMQPDNRWMTNYAFSAEWDIKKHLLKPSSPVTAFSANASWARLGKLLSDDRFNAGAQYRVDLGWASEPTLGSYAGIPGISRPYTSGWVGYGIPWSYSDQLNLGIRLATLQNRLKIAVDLYNKDDKQMLLPVPVPTEWGYTGAYQSGMHVNNKGVELALQLQLLEEKKNKVGWDVSLNVSYNENKLIALPGGLREVILGNNKLVVGQRVDAFWAIKNFGIFKTAESVPVNPLTGKTLTFQGMPLKAGDPYWMDVNGDYVINDKDKVLAGNYIPKVTGGLANSLSYKAFTLDMQFYFAFGRKLLNQYASSRLDFINTEASNSINSVKEITFWQKKMDLSSYPLYNPWASIVPYRLDQDLFVDHASFFKLRSASLSYKLIQHPSRKKKKSISGCEIYVTGTNLLTLTRFKGDDPELVNYNGIYTGYGLPLSRTFITGIKLSL